MNTDDGSKLKRLVLQCVDQQTLISKNQEIEAKQRNITVRPTSQTMCNFFFWIVVVVVCFVLP